MDIKKFLEKFIIIIAVILISAVFVRAGDYFGGNKEQELCPVGMVFIDSDAGGFCIDQYEASAGEDCSFADPENQDKTRVNLNEVKCKPESVAGAMPWRFISQDQAKVACARAGKRLATNKQWLTASLGTIDLNADWSEVDCNVNNNWQENPGLTGSGKNCVSAYGVYDMIGNVWEWVDAVSNSGEIDGKVLPDSGFVINSDGESLPNETSLEKGDENYNLDYFWIKKNEVKAMARGGYWNNKTDAGIYSIYNEVPPAYAGSGIGFRCVK